MSPPPLELAIVTSCSGYGIYLREWADSIVKLTRRPSEVCLVTQGAPADRLAAEEAAALLRAAAFPVKLEHLAGPVDFGTARNAAVALSSSPWVMHLDADDMLMPHALDDIAALMPGADIIALGYQRCGDLASGPRQAVKLYRSSEGLGVLENPTPCSGVSPFRRSLWERSPYRTDMVGGWDTALWIGFARLGARIRPTTRPGFWYRQHADSIFNVRRKSGWPAHRAGLKLRSLRRDDRGVDLLVPFAPDGGARDRAWRWIRARYEALAPSWGIRLGASPERGPWRKGVALANALAGSRADVVIIADADCLVSIDALEKAVALVRSGAAPWVVPHGQVHRLTPDATDELLGMDPATPEILGEGRLARPSYLGFAGGGMLVVGRAELEATGGIPAGFGGWGAEDEALAVILDSLLGPHTRLDAELVHCWHPSQPGRTGPDYRANRALLQRIRAAASEPERLWALVSGARPSDLEPYLDPTTRVETHGARGRLIRDEAAMVRDSFAERRLAAQFEGKSLMSIALDLKHAHRATRIAQAARNLEAERQRNAPKAVLEPPANKALLELPAVKFASPNARAAAMASGRGLAAFAGIVAGPRGLTLAQVQEALR